ncbi:SGNH/GDSL hydrolase family protein [Aquisphaera insulae]|uniref:SGNH/GDSL hydrolase family protein n=1 Tax=Aquisphaera insulae TaxID=2712864 RepID=UPI0013EB96AE|nr:SGNH/GDSL hydrolase family protein [Aquisphaera insulae]
MITDTPSEADSQPPDSDPSSPAVEAEAARPRSGRRRRWLFRVLTLLLLLIGQEVLFRAIFPIPDAPRFNRIHYQQMAQTHPSLGKALDRGLVYDRLRIASRPDGFVTIHSLNLRGFRGPDFAIEPAPGRRRILVIGDSVIEGEGAGNTETIPAAWSRILAREGTDAEVINLGVIAASLPHLWSILREGVPLLRPTDVVVALYANDMPSTDVRGLESPPRRIGLERPDSRSPRLAVLLDRVIHDRPIHRRWFHPPIDFFAPVPDSTNPWSDGRPRPPGLREDLYDDMRAGRLNPWLIFQSAEMPGLLSHDFAAKGGSPRPFLEAMRAACRSSGARLMVAYTPFLGVVHPRYAPALVALGMDPATAEALPVDPKYRSQPRHLAEVCRALDIPLADATAALEAAEASEGPQYWPYDTHPNPAGYATIARHIHQVWKDSINQPPGSP